MSDLLNAFKPPTEAEEDAAVDDKKKTGNENGDATASQDGTNDNDGEQPKGDDVDPDDEGKQKTNQNNQDDGVSVGVNDKPEAEEQDPVSYSSEADEPVVHQVQRKRTAYRDDRFSGDEEHHARFADVDTVVELQTENQSSGRTRAESQVDDDTRAKLAEKIGAKTMEILVNVLDENNDKTIAGIRGRGFFDDEEKKTTIEQKSPSDEQSSSSGKDGDLTIHGDQHGDDIEAQNGGSEDEPLVPPAKKKFGTWDGVFVSCLLNIFGVIMFLRLGWVVGQAGIAATVGIILLSGVVVTLTALSMSAIATNGEVKAGGAYYMISRAIGPHIGGAIGVLFALGNCVAVALYIIGFCETFQLQFGDSLEMAGGTNDIRIYGLILLVFLFAIAWVGVGWVIKLQVYLLALLVCAIVCFLVGSFTNTDLEYGITGWDDWQASENAGTDFQSFEGIDYDFFGVFAVFFPAVTGIMAGANISGDLEDPSVAIPKGTLSAIGLSTVVYIIMAFFLGAVAQRTVENDDSEEKGLIFDTLIMLRIELAEGYLVSAGIYAATFSSALASLIGAPRILQSVAKDHLLPCLDPFAVLHTNGDPRRAMLVTLVVAAGCVLIGKLNAIAPLISMFFMMTYALVNYSCFWLTISESPGWRPSFKYFNQYTAGIGCLFCLVCMFLTNVYYAGGSFLIALILWAYLKYLDPQVNWGNALEARQEYDAIRAMVKLRTLKTHTKNFRPNYLILTKHPDPKNSPLIRFGTTLRHGFGLTIYGHVVKGNLNDDMELLAYQYMYGDRATHYVTGASKHLEIVTKNVLNSENEDALGVHQIEEEPTTGNKADPREIVTKMACDTASASTHHDGVQIEMTEPNHDHDDHDDHDDDDDFKGFSAREHKHMRRDTLPILSRFQEMIQESELEKQTDRKAIDTAGLKRQPSNGDGQEDEIDCLIKCAKTCSYEQKLLSKEDEAFMEYVMAEDLQSGTRSLIHLSGLGMLRINTVVLGFLENWLDAEQSIIDEHVGIIRDTFTLSLGLMCVKNAHKINYERKPDGYVDVWWTRNDGGLIMLITHILLQHRFWSCSNTKQIRVFLVSSEEDAQILRQRLKVLRFPWQVYYVAMPSVGSLSDETSLIYDNVIARPGFRLEDQSPRIRVKTYKYLRLHEAVKEHSRAAKLVIMTIPNPKRGIDGTTYMSWLEVLTKPFYVPVILMAGTGHSVLTAKSE